MRKFFRVMSILLVMALVGNIPVSFGSGEEDKLLEQFKKVIKPTEPLLPPDAKIEYVFKPGIIR